MYWTPGTDIEKRYRPTSETAPSEGLVKNAAIAARHQRIASEPRADCAVERKEVERIGLSNYDPGPVAVAVLPSVRFPAPTWLCRYYSDLAVLQKWLPQNVTLKE